MLCSLSGGSMHDRSSSMGFFAAVLSLLVFMTIAIASIAVIEEPGQDEMFIGRTSAIFLASPEDDPRLTCEVAMPAARSALGEAEPCANE